MTSLSDYTLKSCGKLVWTKLFPSLKEENFNVDYDLEFYQKNI